MKLVLHYMKRYKQYIFLNILAVFGFAAAELGIPTIVSDLIDNGISQNDTSYVYHRALILFVVALLGGLGNIVLAYCSSRASSSIVRDMRNDIFKKSQEFSHTEYNKFGVSSMITRTMNDAFVLMQFLNVIFRTAMMTPIMMLISMFMVLKTSVSLSMVIGACIPILILGIYLIAKTSSPISARQQQGMDRLNRISRENLTGVRVIRAFCKDHYESKRFADANEDYAENAKKLFKLMSVSQPAFFLLLNLGVVVVYIISSRMINVGTLQVGQLVAFQEYMFHAMFSMMLFSTVFMMYPRASISAKRIRELLEEEPLIQNPENPVMDGDQSTSLVFDHVSFQYPDGEAAVLQDISFEAHAGETIAFIGSTGSGKSTLINLIPRFYDISTGSIKVDGVDVRRYDLKALREKIGFIPQKALLFSGSIRENIRYGKHDALKDELDHSTKVAEAYDFIKEKPKKYDEKVVEGGGNFSGGQRQRLSISRAVVRKPELYIFDDSFSALDLKTDAALRKNLKPETKDAITLIVAQRVSSIMDATKIIVLNEGRVVGEGTHKELLESCPVYREIAESQLSKEELEA